MAEETISTWKEKRMNKNDFLHYVSNLGDQFYPIGGISDKKVIDEFENKIGYMLPECYRWYLENYGSGGVTGVDILGLGYDNFNTNLECYEDNLDIGLPIHFLSVIYYGEILYCIDLSDNKEISNVYSWAPGHLEKENNNFFDFIIKMFSGALL